MKNLTKSDSFELYESSGRLFWGMAEKYQFSTADQILLLGLNSNNSHRPTKFKHEKSIPTTDDALHRVGILMGIHKALRIIYPENPSLRYNWFLRPFAELPIGTQSPFDFLRTSPAGQCLLRMQALRALVDRVRIHG